MDSRISNLTRKLQAKYGELKIGESYEVDGKFYRVTDGNLNSLYIRMEALNDKINKK